jgi:PAS domain S-box-containing protein
MSKIGRRSRVKSWHILLLAGAAGAGFWLLDSVYAFVYFRQHLRFMLFDPPASFLDALILNTTPYSLLVRLSFLNLCLAGGLLAAAYISQRHNAEQRLRAERDYSAGIIEGSPSIIFGATPEGQITFLNRAAEEALGFAASEAVGRPWWHIFDGSCGEEAARTHFLILAEGRVRDYHMEVHSREGQARTIAWSVIRRPRHGENGEEIIGFGRDITESKQAEQRLRHRLAVEEMLAQASGHFVSAGRVNLAEVLQLLVDVMQSSRAYIFRVDADGRPCGAYEATADLAPPRSEPAAAFSWVLSRETHVEFFEKVCLDVVLPRLEARGDVVVQDVDVLPPSMGVVREAMAAHDVRALAIVPICSPEGVLQGFLGMDDTRQPRVWPEEDRQALHVVAGMVATYWERTAAEEELRRERSSLAERVAERTEALQAANIELARAARLKDEFLAAMSHELRTPLNAILGLSEALQENVYGPLNERQRQSLGTIERSGQHLLDLINDVLDVARIGAGKMELELWLVSVPSVCETCLRLVRRDAARAAVSVSAELDESVKWLIADERRLKQMLINLLGNAIKFTPKGGAIGLIVKGDLAQQRVHFTVWDTGIGIAAEDVPRLFQPFVQLDSSLSRQYQGSGLGLALVHQMAELHGGSVSVESQVGEGSRFTVSLPWRQKL